MYLQKAIFGRTVTRRALGLLACVALLYSPRAVSLSRTYEWARYACHVCQALHMPALALHADSSARPRSSPGIHRCAARSAKRFLLSASRRARTSDRLIFTPDLK